MGQLTIGQLAHQSGVGVETIKFYQRRGLVEQPPRPASGFRKYPPEAVRQVRFIRRAKELGFSLQEIGELLDLRMTAGIGCGAIRERAEAKLADIRQKRRDLERMEAVLKQLTASCRGQGPLNDCPILGALDDEETNRHE
ncbi:heavy metal-responsive transcriptional regulator [Geothermobacter hydrogeniphilus]|uniref:Mercuric resistance operon regulatory protein n=1 Tax=Geothermobacter hydrogeniphilus TaxID=1969733 RepID=A0A2K2HB20_9BACT|nr:MerR family DNA-binding protein [Geothermobacter hydrogeniphilus]PNU20504.1 heavy metal-responsive transcriptional regulator [Geothermobacter hydrogeniphilus]